MPNMTVSGDARKFFNKNTQVWSSWQAFAHSESLYSPSLFSLTTAVRVPVEDVRISRVNISIPFTIGGAWYSGYPKITVCLYTDDPETNPPIAETESYPEVYNEEDTISFNLDNLSIVITDNFYYTIDVSDGGSIYTESSNCVLPGECSVTYTNIPALTPSISLPSGTYSGGDQILFSWQTSGEGTQTKAVLEWSTDAATWSALTTVGTNQTYLAPRGKFPAGTVFWRIKVTSSYGVESNWVQRSFTVRYNTATVTLIAPTSGTHEGGERIKFAWSIANGSGSVTGVQFETSSDSGISWTNRLDSTNQQTEYTANQAELPPGALRWRVRAKDSYAGWGEWKTANITIKYSATSYVTPTNSPTGGNVNAANPITFTGTLNTDGVPYTPFVVQSATFYWRARTTDSYTAVQMTPSGSNATVTIQGGTFPAGSVYWYIEATDNAGTTTETSVYQISTLASDIDAQPVSPINTVEINNSSIHFVWRFASTSGESQNGAELQYSLDNETWEQLAEVEGDTTSVIAPPDTFRTRTIYWRVRAFNSVGDSGPWSTVAQFVAYGAPEAPTVTVDAVPFATIHWQGDDQTSFEVDVDGVTYGPFLGEEKSYELYNYLEDGSHIVRVRILGGAALWSLWGETSFEIANVPESTLTIRARTNVDTELMWTGGNGNYHVYRDGKLIARTNERSFIDRAVLGVHEYKVVERLASGNYNASGTLTRTMEVGCMHIAALEGGDWIEILHTLKSQSDPSYTYSAEAEFANQDNSEFPVVSIGPYLDEEASYSAVFLYNEPDEHRRFRALFRKPVILKTTDDVVMFGILNAWERKPKTSRAKQYYTAYTFSLRRIDWEDFIDDTI